VTYFSPERRYEKTELDMSGVAWARIEDEIAAYGDQEMAVDLTFCCNHIQACFIARRLFYMARADFGMLRTNMAGIAAWGKRTALINIPDVGDGEGTLTVRARLDSVRPDDNAGTVEIPYQIIPDILSVAFDPAEDAAPAPPLLVPQQVETDLDMPDQPAEATIVQYPDTSREMRVRYTTPPGGDITEAVYRVYAGGVPGVSQSMTEVEAAIDYAWVEVTYNHWTDPGFDNSGAHLLGPGWSVAGSKLVGVPDAAIQGAGQNFALPARDWVFSGTMSDRVAGSVTPRIVGTPNVDGAAISTNGAFSQVLTNASAGTGGRWRKDTTFDGKIDNQGLHEDGLPIVELGTELDFRVRIFTTEGESSFFSDELHVGSLAIDNTATAAPTQSVTGSNGDWDVETTAPVDLNVAYIQIEKKVHVGAWTVASTQNARPDGLYTLNITDGVSAGQTIQIRSRAFTSNGTASAYSSVFSFTEPL
jgi:hypothetical protein